jgi:8-oxo-dGTP diphosphatase
VIKYVLGLAFDMERTTLAVIEKKTGPACNVGKLNGVGGKVEAGEDYLGAMEREFLEETGVLVPALDWGYKGSFYGVGWRVAVFVTFTDMIWNCKTVEDEPILFAPVESVRGDRYTKNLPRLVDMCLDDSVKEFFWREK